MMKRLSSRVLACLIFLIILSGVSVAQTYRLQLEKSGLDMPMLFEDQMISEEVKNAVLDDYKVLFDPLEINLRSTRRQPTEILVGGSNFKIVGGIDFKHKRIPDGYEKDFMIVCVRQGSKEEYVYVPKHLSDGYKQAMVLKAEHEEAFPKLDNFLNFMNNLEKEVEERNITDPREFIHFTQESKIASDFFCFESVMQFVEHNKRYLYKKASLLELGSGADLIKAHLESGRAQVAAAIEGLENVIYYTKIIVVGTESNNEYAMEDTIAYFNDGKWKLLR